MKAVGPREARDLIDALAPEIIDVRDPDELSTGHIPGARNVPLPDLKTDPRATLRRQPVLFVCARGMRSQTAARLALEIGLRDVYHLHGGMQAWQAEGLPVETPLPPEPAPPRPVPTPLPEDSSCGLPPPGLDVVVGANLRELRLQRGLSLDQLARLTGLSRTLLGQIELGRMSPSVSVVWRIAQAFGVHFSALLASSERRESRVLRVGDARRLVSPDGRFSSRALYPAGDKPDAEFYELRLSAHSREDAQAHAPGTRENLVVTAGRLELVVGAEHFELATGDAIVFTADVPHAYVNPGHQECWMYLVMTYAGGG